MHFETFDTAEEMFDAIEANERAAEAAVTEWQKRIKVGDYVMSYNPDEGFWIFSEQPRGPGAHGGAARCVGARRLQALPPLG
jgi:hypothetical protein